MAPVCFRFLLLLSALLKMPATEHGCLGARGVLSCGEFDVSEEFEASRSQDDTLNVALYRMLANY